MKIKIVIEEDMLKAAVAQHVTGMFSAFYCDPKDVVLVVNCDGDEYSSDAHNFHAEVTTTHVPRT